MLNENNYRTGDLVFVDGTRLSCSYSTKITSEGTMYRLELDQHLSGLSNWIYQDSITRFVQDTGVVIAKPFSYQFTIGAMGAVFLVPHR